MTKFVLFFCVAASMLAQQITPNKPKATKPNPGACQARSDAPKELAIRMCEALGSHDEMAKMAKAMNVDVSVTTTKNGLRTVTYTDLSTGKVVAIRRSLMIRN